MPCMTHGENYLIQEKVQSDFSLFFFSFSPNHMNFMKID